MKKCCKGGRLSFRNRLTQANGPVEPQLCLPTCLESGRRWCESRRDATSSQPVCLRFVFPDASGGGQAQGGGEAKWEDPGFCPKEDTEQAPQGS